VLFYKNIFIRDAAVRCVMKKWSCQRSSATPDDVTKKNSTDMLFMSTEPAAQKKNRPSSAD
jgi:hypothetical protein